MRRTLPAAWAAWVVALGSGCGQQEQRDAMLRAHEQQVREVEARRAESAARHDAEMKRLAAETLVWQFKSLASVIQLARMKALTALGRPAESADELAPFFEPPGIPASPRDGGPLGVNFGPRRLIVWEVNADADGNRYVVLGDPAFVSEVPQGLKLTPGLFPMLGGYEVRRVTEAEFAALQAEAAPAPPPTTGPLPVNTPAPEPPITVISPKAPAGGGD